MPQVTTSFSHAKFCFQFYNNQLGVCRVLKAQMEFYLPHVLAFLTLAVVATQAAMPPELYWNSVLHNTPMPKAIKDLLYPDSMDEKGTSVIVGNGVNKVMANGNYNYGAEAQLHYDPDLTLYFFEKDMHPGKTMNLNFTENPDRATFLPRQVVNSIPFSSNKLPEIFNQFSVKPGSLEAEIMTSTIKECENPGIKGEEKYCATSLESMIDFSTSKLGKNIQAVSAEVEKQTQLQKYTITAGVKMMAGDKSVVCHKENYAYAVFFCHAIQNTRAYMVPLKGADGTKVKAVAVCHRNTSEWNPKHLAFQLLKVKPGTVPVCHFLAQHNIVWVPN